MLPFGNGLKDDRIHVPPNKPNAKSALAASALIQFHERLECPLNVDSGPAP